MDYSQYAMDYLRIIYDIDVLLSLSQDWVGRGIIFYFSHTHVIGSALHSSLLFLVMFFF